MNFTFHFLKLFSGEEMDHTDKKISISGKKQWDQYHIGHEMCEAIEQVFNQWDMSCPTFSKMNAG